MKNRTKNHTYLSDTELTLTFDDVLLQPAYSEILPNETSLKTQLTKNIKLNIPLLSAAMDTVTEEDMAIALAREGGLGIIHKNMSIEMQAEQVKRVKRSENGIITNPITLNENACLGDAIKLKQQYKIGGIPIINKEFKLVGILTNRDVRSEKNMNTPIKKLMTHKHLITVSPGISLKKAEEVFNKYKVEKLPIVNNKGNLKGLITYRDVTQYKNYPVASKDSTGKLLVGAAVGITNDLYERVGAIYKAGVDLIVLDSAHGHTKSMISCVKELRKQYKNKIQILAGNIATKEAALALGDAKVDAVKVGIGPGSICTTRVVTGVGVPQLSAIINVVNALKKSSVGVVADGGIRYSGDVVKALAAGASCVMMGSVFAGTQESPGETILFEGRKFKLYRGMGSIGAMKQGSADRYFQAETKNKKSPYDNVGLPSTASKLVPEGIEGRIAFKGSVSEIVLQYTGGLRSGMGYCGAKDLKALAQAKFVRISSSGVIENHPHNITITREAPNYSKN